MSSHDDRSSTASKSADLAVRQVDLPPDARLCTTLPRLDYTDAFVLDSASCHELSVEQWARCMLEGAPRTFRWTAPWGWRALGLERGPATSANSVLTWPIKERSDDIVLLSAGGRLGMSGELLFARRPEGMLFATLLELRTRLARAEWASIAPAHRRIVTGLLRRAHREQRR